LCPCPFGYLFEGFLLFEIAEFVALTAFSFFFLFPSSLLGVVQGSLTPKKLILFLSHFFFLPPFVRLLAYFLPRQPVARGARSLSKFWLPPSVRPSPHFSPTFLTFLPWPVIVGFRRYLGFIFLMETNSAWVAGHLSHDSITQFFPRCDLCVFTGSGIDFP